MEGRGADAVKEGREGEESESEEEKALLASTFAREGEEEGGVEGLGEEGEKEEKRGGK